MAPPSRDPALIKEIVNEVVSQVISMPTLINKDIPLVCPPDLNRQISNTTNSHLICNGVSRGERQRQAKCKLPKTKCHRKGMNTTNIINLTGKKTTLPCAHSFGNRNFLYPNTDVHVSRCPMLLLCRIKCDHEAVKCTGRKRPFC